MNENNNIVSFETAKAISRFLSTYRECVQMPRYDWAYDYDIDCGSATLNYYGGRRTNDGYDAYYISDVVEWVCDYLSISIWIEVIGDNDNGYVTIDKLKVHILPLTNKPLYEELERQGKLEYETSKFCRGNNDIYDEAIKIVLTAYEKVLDKEYNKYDEMVCEYEQLIKRVRESD